MNNTGRYPLPDDVRDDPTCREYHHLHPGDNSPLHDDYCHYIRKDCDEDNLQQGLWYGEWEDVTEKDKAKAIVEKKRKELKKMEEEKKLLEKEIKQLSKELEEEE